MAPARGFNRYGGLRREFEFRTPAGSVVFRVQVAPRHPGRARGEAFRQLAAQRPDLVGEVIRPQGSGYTVHGGHTAVVTSKERF